jgi:hypothetical protein
MYQFHDAIALFAPHAAEEALCQVLYGGFQIPAEDPYQIRLDLLLSQGVFDKLWQAALNSST